LLNGLDDIGLTLQHVSDIAAFEAQRPAWLPTTLDVGTPVRA
jgi:3-isopropylmalate/(R)-2-methylmalate dehydratase small subunit